MNKKILTITLILAIFIIIAILFSMQFQNAKKENSNSISQAEKLSTSQSENTTTANSVPENTLSIEEMRKLEIENRIKEYGKQENGVPVLMYHFFYDESAGKVNTDTSQCSLMYESDYINFESHTHNMHKAGKNGKGLLVNVSYEKAYQDIEQSISILNSKEAFCYPFGHYNDTAKQVLKDIGYKVAFTTKYGRVKVGMNPLELPRIRILRDDSISSFIAKVN